MQVHVLADPVFKNQDPSIPGRLSTSHPLERRPLAISHL